MKVKKAIKKKKISKDVKEVSSKVKEKINKIKYKPLKISKTELKKTPLERNIESIHVEEIKPEIIEVKERKKEKLIFVDSEIKNQIEALLFSAGKAMDEEDLSLTSAIPKKEVRKALEQLKQDYDSRDSSLMIFNEESFWKISVRKKYLDLVRKVVADTELPKSVLETLAVIAWKMPILQSKVIHMRGNKAYDHIEQLVELGFVIKEKSGRSYALRIGKKFLDYFDVEGNENIKEIFKNLKLPQKPVEKKKEEKKDEKELQKKLGELAVVNIDKKTEESRKTKEIFEHKQEGNLEVVDVEEKPEAEEVKDDTPLGEKINDETDDFLKKIDDKIEEISKRHSEIEIKRENIFSDEERKSLQDEIDSLDKPAETEENAEEPTEETSEEPESGEETYEEKLKRRVQERMLAEEERRKQAEEENNKEDKKKTYTKKQLKTKFKDEVVNIKQKIEDKKKRIEEAKIKRMQTIQKKKEVKEKENK